MNQALVDLYSSEISKSSGFKEASSIDKGIYQKVFDKLHIDPTLIDDGDDAVKMIKVRFFYDVIINRQVKLYPQSLKLLFFKALFAIERLKNKYLTLTLVTHINLYSKRKHSYLQ